MDSDQQQMTVLSQLSDTLANLRSELVLQRQSSDRRLAEEFDAVNEYEFSAAAGGPISPKPLTATAIRVDSILISTSTTTSSIQLHKGGPKIPIVAAGFILLAPIKLILPSGERPILSDTSATATLYIEIFGYALPTRANAT